ncbi:MAG: endonuclease V [Clostridia bacterium]|nr:endonuclease V [Clostridia bacterium]
MKITWVHDFINRDESYLLKIQKELKEKIHVRHYEGKLDIVAGVDLAYFDVGGREYAVCVIVLIDFKTLNIIKTYYEYGEIDFPYISGFLAFRELPLFLKAWEKVEVEPDLVVFDGQGMLHPQRMGIATHASFFIEKPTIGVGKTYFKFNSTEFVMPDNAAGTYSFLKDHNETVGVALRTHKDVKPIFVSVGNFISLEQAMDIVMKMVTKESRLPVATRYADIETHRLREKYLSQ